MEKDLRLSVYHEPAWEALRTLAIEKAKSENWSREERDWNPNYNKNSGFMRLIYMLGQKTLRRRKAMDSDAE